MKIIDIFSGFTKSYLSRKTRDSSFQSAVAFGAICGVNNALYFELLFNTIIEFKNEYNQFRLTPINKVSLQKKYTNLLSEQLSKIS